jgi:two-component system cell cycle response regulator DivK
VNFIKTSGEATGKQRAGYWRPLLALTISEISLKNREKQGVRHLPAATGRCVPLVEDQEDSRRILRDLLGNAGFELMEAESGEDALSAVMARRPDLIWMDIQLPAMAGYEAAQRIRSNPEMKEVPIIAVTSYALAGDDAKALAAGCSCYISKPFSPRALLAKVREYLA